MADADQSMSGIETPAMQVKAIVASRLDSGGGGGEEPPEKLCPKCHKRHKGECLMVLCTTCTKSHKSTYKWCDHCKKCVSHDIAHCPKKSAASKGADSKALATPSPAPAPAGLLPLGYGGLQITGNQIFLLPNLDSASAYSLGAGLRASGQNQASQKKARRNERNKKKKAKKEKEEEGGGPKLPNNQPPPPDGQGAVSTA